MGKSSSSKRSRRTIASSSARSRKSDRIKSRKARSNKSSLRRRRHESDSRSSSGSDYDSRSSYSSSSGSYSSSEDDYRRRKDGRKIRKRVRRDSDPFSTDGSPPRYKRRKESGRKVGSSRSKRKSDRGSRLRRDASVSYSSCSTCADRSVSEDEYESRRGRSGRRESRRGRSGKRESRRGRSGKRESRRGSGTRDRSGSCSSYRQCSRSSSAQHSMLSGDSRSEERATDENNSRRLRSVIVVVNAMERGGEENKEEFVYDKDDYPSSRSNDSNDDESKKELGHDLRNELEMKGMRENRKGKEVVVSNLDGEPRSAGRNVQDENQGSGGSSGTNQKDLESMLRQRALLNLQKLRGVKKCETSHVSLEPNVAAAKDEPELPREGQVSASGALSRDGSGDVSGKTGMIEEKAVFARLGTVSTGKQPASSSVGLVKRNVASVPRQQVLSAVGPALSNPWRTAYTWRRESTFSQQRAKQLISPQKPKPPQQKPTRNEISTSTGVAESPLKASVLNQLPAKELSLPPKLKPHQTKPMATETTKSTSVAESSRNELASGVTPVEELSLPEKPKPPSQAKPAVTQMEATASAVGDGQTGSTTANQTSLNELLQQGSLDTDQSTEAKAEPGGTVSSEKVVDDAAGKEGPRYEQKTMSVTRGGETIQVNYQVYIPKRAPSLARRQLKRDS
ncbi:hypothetical protein MLD38_000489 [Melastoma candidum]|uniref:Uncharacterized protein n=1 Tax=Melastoma candidum TaxID=119954 RepID=A0ACB9SDJ5_9MYRT|nr:hypothetical protein MLD38_000489 [Melastoma candidum]